MKFNNKKIIIIACGIIYVGYLGIRYRRTITNRDSYIFLYQSLKVLMKISLRVSVFIYQPIPIRSFYLLKPKINKLFHLSK